jgi:hypothetical protein
MCRGQATFDCAARPWAGRYNRHMRRPSRFRRFAKWIGIAVCVLILSLWAWSIRRGVQYSGPRVFVDIGAGSVAFAPRDHATASREWTPYRIRGYLGLSAPGLIRGRVGVGVLVPVWIPLLLVGLTTVFLWWRDRSVPPGHCEGCGYDLTGNVSGVCPECGQKVSQAGYSEGTK